MDQTLIAGAAAALAAWLTIRQIRKQIAQVEEHRIDALARRHRMLRAGLPVALAEITNYAERCATEIWSVRSSVRNDDLEESVSAYSRKLPDIPSSALRDVQAVIETADGLVISDLECLLIFFQIQNTRLERFTTQEYLSLPETAGQIADALFLKAATVRLFEYARGKNKGAEEWLGADWALNQIPSIALADNTEFIDDDLQIVPVIKRQWPAMIERYGNFQAADMK